MTATNTFNFQVEGDNDAALFTLKIHRGEGMCLLAMNWKKDKPTKDFVGFAIEYKEPGGTKFYALSNRLGFPNIDGSADPNKLSTFRSPIQKFRWVHFPFHPDIPGDFIYRVTPVFMDLKDKLSYGEPQTANIQLMSETYPDELNVCFTRGFVASQSFVDQFQADGHTVSELIPLKANLGLDFKPTHPDAKRAYEWMGFEARADILDVLDKAIADKKAEVRVIAYDLNIPDIVDRLEKIGKRLKVIIDVSADHKKTGSAENAAADRLKASAGEQNVKRQKMGALQHNKTIIVNSPDTKLVVCGSTNFSWRAFFVQSNNAIIMEGENAIKPFLTAFDNYWKINDDSVPAFGNTASAKWNDLGLASVNAKVAFSPHVPANALYQSIADDIGTAGISSVLYSLAFLYESPGAIKDTIKKITRDKNIFVYGIADKEVGGIDLQTPDGNLAPVYPSALVKADTPEPFKSEPTGGSGTRMHHKFIVIDFNKPSARVYIGSYNFSSPADTSNGENLLLIKDRRIATSYMIEALSIFDHYEFRLVQANAKKARKVLSLKKPPAKEGIVAWWEEDYKVARKIHDRELFS